ncbi:hypothetical protein RFI_14602 [Reticulomyxa filosa]|uniref:Uncharacterized protein n=1 Tax=Reticulomyxa filosa TaxID=46433 RepID=X6N961_RETFI|nr:hypothetical protein RFI_25094 [Reticulomyxa filosa]ETO22591.1 hypothetical protein RFI_14602 [Reticulomyxa filosa]|eukprot:ETO12282.1 hypothetical protein RFI_25094 [Reticulomyxa filosa]
MYTYIMNYEEHQYELLSNGKQGHFRVGQYNDLLSGEEMGGYDTSKGFYVRAKWDCDFTFSEQLELHNFPVDCQDFAIVIHELSGYNRVRLMPEPRHLDMTRQIKSSFVGVDRTFSVLDEWDFVNTRAEFSNTDSGNSRSGKAYQQLALRFKMKRSM